MLKIKLKVEGAKKRDIGRNISRIAPDIMNKLNLEQGKYVILYGKKISASCAWASYSADNSEIMRIDSRIRYNTGTEIEDMIEVEKVVPKTAQSVVLAPLDIKIKTNPEFESFIKRKLFYFPITIDDMINISIGIDRYIKFIVIKIIPEDVLLIKAETSLKLIEDKIENC